MSNGARFAARPIAGGGTAAEIWRAADLAFPELTWEHCPGLVVVAPHPDDETLGLGGTIAAAAERGIPVRVVSVSDGDAAHPDATAAQRRALAQTRRDEVRCAAAALGIGAPMRLGLPDGDVAAHQARVADALTEVLAAEPAGVWCAATWRGDGHPDHEAVGRAAAEATSRTGAVLLEYPVWMWHWAEPGDATVPWHRARRSSLTHSATQRKVDAAQCFHSQFEPDGPEAVLPPYVLARLLTVGEVVFR
ncbi:PIG-L family deacetylase [Mycobacterium manitobense]|uniref:PIG-L family deacetylase n=1 Tax=[Mycobacterium] manitobense TaxID=190147 RepID=A0A9X3BXH0_9MYCO|nr:PIG-L family deacetylase [[Mycobacterium] manitobense]MCV7172621.1 PIG-L family deacetylase [[Mycobacterium] manitobense]